MQNSKIKILFCAIVLFLSTSVAYSEERPESGDASGSLFKDQTFIKNPLELRDPFKRKLKKKSAQTREASRETDVFTNKSADKIEEKAIENIRIVGVLIGKERRAMAKISQGKTLGTEVYFIKEGMKLGPNGAEVKAILAGGIVLVEKIRNVYDQDEYVETIIPVSAE